MTGDPKTYCSDLSLQAGEALYGTATPTRHFLLLEYNGAWDPKAFEASAIPAEVKARLSSLQKATPATKLLLIKSRRGLVEAGISFFIANPTETSPCLFAYQLSAYTDLLDLDIAALLAGEPPSAAPEHPEPLFLVCTNGKRDACCALHGWPAYRRLIETEDQSAWQCTHLGGHRFAANFLCLPHGLLYGRVREETVTALAAEYRRGRLALDYYRGRTCYEAPVQAAEFFLRRATGQDDVEAFSLRSLRESDPRRWQARFQDKETASIYRLIVTQETTAATVFESCHLDKTTPLVRYHLEEIATEAEQEAK